METKVKNIYIAPQNCQNCPDQGRKSEKVCIEDFNCILFDVEKFTPPTATK